VLLMSTPADLIPDDDSVELDFRELFGIEEANDDDDDDDDVEVIHMVTAGSEASSLKRPISVVEDIEVPNPKRPKTSRHMSRTNSDLLEAFENLEKENMELRENLAVTQHWLKFLESEFWEQTTVTTTRQPPRSPQSPQSPLVAPSTMTTTTSTTTRTSTTTPRLALQVGGCKKGISNLLRLQSGYFRLH